MAKVIHEKVAVVNLTRKGGKVQLQVRTSPDIEALFSGMAGDVHKVNGKAGTIEWYPVPIKTTKFNKWAGQYLLNTPDKGLDFDRMFNFSFIFCKGVSNGITLEFSDLYTKEQLESYAKDMTVMLREIYNEFVSDFTVQHELSLKGISV